MCRYPEEPRRYGWRRIWFCAAVVFLGRVPLDRAQAVPYVCRYQEVQWPQGGSRPGRRGPEAGRRQAGCRGGSCGLSCRGGVCRGGGGLGIAYFTLLLFLPVVAGREDRCCVLTLLGQESTLFRLLVALPLCPSFSRWKQAAMVGWVAAAAGGRRLLLLLLLLLLLHPV